MSIRLVPALVVCALALAGCAQAKTTEAPTAESAATAPAEAVPSATATSAPAVEATLVAVKPQAKTLEDSSAEDGKRFGFFKKVTLSGEDVVITVDYAQMLSGTEAAEAASARGDESPPPNDYYIVNDNPKLRTFKLAKDASVKYLVGGEPLLRKVSATGFLGKWEAAGGDATILRNPYWLTIKGGVVVALEQQYLP